MREASKERVGGFVFKTYSSVKIKPTTKYCSIDSLIANNFIWVTTKPN